MIAMDFTQKKCKKSGLHRTEVLHKPERWSFNYEKLSQRWYEVEEELLDSKCVIGGETVTVDIAVYSALRSQSHAVCAALGVLVGVSH